MYHELMDYLLRKGIEMLYEIGEITGLTYAEVNIWLFIILMPSAIVGLLAWNFYLLGKLRAFRQLVGTSKVDEKPLSDSGDFVIDVTGAPSRQPHTDAPAAE